MFGLFFFVGSRSYFDRVGLFPENLRIGILPFDTSPSQLTGLDWTGLPSTYLAIFTLGYLTHGFINLAFLSLSLSRLIGSLAVRTIMAAAKKDLPNLPVEIWTMIIEDHCLLRWDITSYHYIYRAFRPVCRLFKEIVEHVMDTQLLREFKIRVKDSEFFLLPFFPFLFCPFPF